MIPVAESPKRCYSVSLRVKSEDYFSRTYLVRFSAVVSAALDELVRRGATKCAAVLRMDESA